MNELSQQIIRSENYELNYYPDITFIIPAYNEEKRISYVIDDLSNYIDKNKLNWNIITSIDGTDNTKNIVNDYSSKYDFIIMDTSKSRSGKGNAIKRALINHSSILKDFVIFMDADNSIKFDEILNAMNNIENNDVIILNRYCKENNIPFLRKFLGRVFNLITRGFLRLKIHDTQSGYKIFKKNIVMKEITKVGLDNAFFDISLLYHVKNDNYNIKEIDSKYEYNKDTSFHVFKLTVNMLLSIFAFKLRYSNLYEKIPEKIKEKLLEIFYKVIND